MGRQTTDEEILEITAMGKVIRREGGKKCYGNEGGKHAFTLG